MVKLNSYILSDDVKDEMRNKLDKTRQDRIELGFTLCANSNNIIRSRGNPTGTSNKIEIDPRACRGDEKFLGGYHTHPKSDSYPSAEDLIHCGIHKIICTGGMDDKIRCNVWKYGQLSSEDKNKMIDEYVSGYNNHKYQQTFDCINDFEPIYREERNIKGLDESLKQLESYLSTPSIRMQYDIAKAGRNLRAGILNGDIKNKSRKYYNEVEIK
jgi:proteasome lid subunit RPN8/RPN11